MTPNEDIYDETEDFNLTPKNSEKTFRIINSNMDYSNIQVLYFYSFNYYSKLKYCT